MKWFHVLGRVYTVLFWVAHSTDMYTVTSAVEVQGYSKRMVQK
jgi:hypothetical protein